MTSLFLTIPASEWVASNALAFAILDRYPVTPGHTLVITRRVVPTWFDATEAEQRAVMALVDEVKRALDRDRAPDGYNVGFNAGASAGQTVDHLHVHVIPRYRGDMDDPRGGVRHVIPARGNYARARDEGRWTPPDAPDAAALIPREGPRLTLLDTLARDLARADRADVVVAFTRSSGVAPLAPHLTRLLARGGRLRLLTSDYLDITQPEALDRLLDLRLRAALNADDADDDDTDAPDPLALRVVEHARLGGRSFHPKGWLLTWPAPDDAPPDGVAIVGSSNLSRAALNDGVEWNLRVARQREPALFDQLRDAFDALWSQGAPLTRAWIAAYRARRRAEPRTPAPADALAPPAPAPPPPAPRPHQAEALTALAQAREEGARRALVVFATGLGKTYLAAFDLKASLSARGDRGRALIVAHRRELLAQAHATFARVHPDASCGLFAGHSDDLDADIVFASVQKLARPDQLQRVPPDAFAYVVIDEAHHAAAATYRRLLDHLAPGFVLGLTATPERADEADLLALFDDRLAARLDLGQGIARGLLVPFAYQGIADPTDFAPIPWRNSRFDPARLAAALQTQARMESLWRAWEAHPGQRTLVFCASVAHARFVARWLSARGARALAVHSGPDSADRAAALDALRAGDLDALCAVDLFNEGLDLPALDRVVMLRPTESPTVFLQQLGRGLRPAPGKALLRVLDLVGNHRVFLDRVRLLLQLSGDPRSLRDALAAAPDADPPELPSGCSVRLELGAVDLLRALMPAPGDSALVERYRELRAARGARPTAGALYRMNLNPNAARSAHEGWLGFVADEGDLSPAEQRARRCAEAVLGALDTRHTPALPLLIALDVITRAGALRAGLPWADLAARCARDVAHSPALRAALDPETPWRAALEGAAPPLWRASDSHGDDAHAALRIDWPDDGDDAPEVAAAVEALTAELVDWGLARARRALERERAGENSAATTFTMEALRDARQPLLRFGSSDDRDRLPRGEHDARIDGEEVCWRFRFDDLTCALARPVGRAHNGLPDLLYRWFGPDAGRPGTAQRVRFTLSPDGWWASPDAAAPAANVIPLRAAARLPAYPALRAAASAHPDASPAPGAAPLALPIAHDGDARDRFAVRVCGDSMDGGDAPLRDGDWLVMRWARGDALPALLDRVVLIASGPLDARRFQLKRLTRAPDDPQRLALASDNPSTPTLPLPPDAQALAVALRAVPPEALAPPHDALVDLDALRDTLGPAVADALTQPSPGPWTRAGGHLVILLGDRARLDAPDRLAALDRLDRQPGESAYVLAPHDGEAGRWRYLGVARWDAARGRWTLPEVDLHTWRRFGASKRGASRPLPAPWRDAAVAFARALADAHLGQTLAHPARPCRLCALTASGSLRIDGGPGGFKPRTVSTTDLGWALKARAAHPAPDQAQVNALRYLRGTPPTATRYIDTGWALRLTDPATPWRSTPEEH